MTKDKVIAVMGDVHHHLWLAVEELNRLEDKLGSRIDQVFSVGDLGLFLENEDWNFLTGPEKYRRPDESPRICEAWREWRWPLSMIGGNHEPFHRLRDFDPSFYDDRLEYTDAGLLHHAIPGLRVYGLTGIHNERAFDRRSRHRPSWSQLLEEVRAGERDIRELTWYRQHDIDQLLALPPRPHILLTHNWPFVLSHLEPNPDFPEWQLLQILRPHFHFSGHRHVHHIREIDQTRFEGLNIIEGEGWVRLLRWEGSRLVSLETP
ncbi:MAG: metallophosphoesterase [Candidatus Methylacidiphilales bacterium]|nr:metallophosphoesterase [Candidatus Methylacidiphilales bacterium]